MKIFPASLIRSENPGILTDKSLSVTTEQHRLAISNSSDNTMVSPPDPTHSSPGHKALSSESCKGVMPSKYLRIKVEIY